MEAPWQGCRLLFLPVAAVNYHSGNSQPVVAEPVLI